jgi:hypothetical protein
LPLGEVLAEIGKAAVLRIAARVDDPRIRQEQMDEVSIVPVVGLLVDLDLLGRLALAPGALEEFGTQLREALMLHPSHGLRRVAQVPVRRRPAIAPRLPEREVKVEGILGRSCVVTSNLVQRPDRGLTSPSSHDAKPRFTRNHDLCRLE